MDSEKKEGYCRSVTEAYLKAFELSEHTDDHIDKTICRAIVFAVDYGKYTLVPAGLLELYKTGILEVHDCHSELANYVMREHDMYMACTL